MASSVKGLTRAALGAAAGTVVLYLSGLLPWGRLALLCASSIGVIAVRMSCSFSWALGCYAATAVMGLLLLPVKAPVILYALFVGYYPLVRLRTARISDKMIRLGIKLAVFNAAAVVIYRTYSALFYDLAGNSALPLYMLWIAANGAFLVYDYALGQIMLYYLRKIAGRMK